MKSLNLFLLLFLFSSIGVFAQSGAEEWIQTKKDCGLDPNLALSTWRAQGSPCNTAKPAVIAPSNSSLNDPNAALVAKDEAEKKAIAEAEAKNKKEEEEREKEKQEALLRMKGTSTQTFGLNAAPPNFDGLKGGQTNNFGLNSSSTTTTGASNNSQFGDPNVVDARNVPSGLSKGTEKAINDVFKDSPSGVSAKVKKAFQSVQIQDWKVAKVWFQEALKLDPNDKGLQTFVLLCDYSYGKKQSQNTSSTSKPDPYSNMNNADKEEIDKHFKELREGNGSWPSPEKIRNYINSISLEDYIKRYNLIMPEKDDIKDDISDLFTKNKNNGSLTAPFETKDFEDIMLNYNPQKSKPSPKKTTNSK